VWRSPRFRVSKNATRQMKGGDAIVQAEQKEPLPGIADGTTMGGHEEGAAVGTMAPPPNVSRS
jgi:hypothetical protein